MSAVAPARGGFVTPLAAISLALGGLGLASNALQLLVAWSLPASGLAAGLLPPGLPVPAPLAWLEAHLAGLSLAGMLGSAVLAWMSWGLLQRREWARRAFIAGLALTALADFAVLPLLDGLFTGVADGAMPSGVDAGSLRATLHALEQALFWSCLAGAVLIAALHAWIGWQLCRPAIRAEFRSPAR